MTGGREKKRKYYHYTGFPGGLHFRTFKQLK